MGKPWNAPSDAICPYVFPEPEGFAVTTLSSVLDDEDTENAFVCPLSKHVDGNHSTSWFDGGTCNWCGKI